MSDAFITSPVLRSQQTSDKERKQSFNMRQKINNILSSFTEKDLLFQAINNIGIPKNFINNTYIESRPDEEMSKIYNAICALKKEILRIKRYSDVPAVNMFAIQSLNKKEEQSNQNKIQKSQDNNFIFAKKQLSTEKRIKMAIEQELHYRQKLETRENKMRTSEKLRVSFNQKRREAAKQINKKSAEVYERQKQIQENWFENAINQQLEKNNETSPLKRVLQVASSIRRQENYDLVKERLEQQKIQLQKYVVEQEIGRVLKQRSIRQFKHRRLNSLNDRIIQRRLKSQQIRQRKNNYSLEDEFSKIQKMIQKQLKIKETRKHKYDKDPRNSDSQVQTSNMLPTNTFFRNNDIKSANYEKDDEKQNQILDKIIKKNQIRQDLLNSQVQKIKQKHKIEELRRQAYKRTQFKLLTENNNNESYVYQKDLGMSKKPLIEFETSRPPDPREQNIKKKHETVLKSALCDQAIMRLRKLPRSILEQQFYLNSRKLKDFKTKELREIFAKNIVKFLH